jgi:hypothetical protein
MKIVLLVLAGFITPGFLLLVNKKKREQDFNPDIAKERA